MIFCYIIVHFVVRRLLCSNAATDISDVGIIFFSVERKYGLEKLSTSAKVSSKNISLLCCWKPFIAALPRMFKICLLVLLTLSFLQAGCPSLMLLVGWQEGHPACKKTEWWGAWVVICLERRADLHMTQLMPLPLTVSCFNKIQIGITFLVPAHPGSPGKRAVKWVCVSVCISDTIGWAIRRASYLWKLFYFHRPVITDWGEVLHPCQHQIGHFGDVLLSQSLGLVPIFTYPTCIWCPDWGSPQWNFVKIFVIRKLESLYYCVVLFARSYV